MRVRGRFAAAATAALLAALAACGDDPAVVPADQRPTPGFELTSPAFAEGEAIPAEHSCEGPSPDLEWTGVPEDTVELALTLLDPDAGNFVHWVAWGIDPASTALPAGAAAPSEGENDAGRPGYFGPCPPEGQRHRYVFTLYALGSPLGLEEGASPSEAVAAVREADVTATAELTGTYTA
jgi:Raf kinase inhibitor-like YbhB/YbcL family protein